MPTNEEGAQLCTHLVNDYGVCSRPREHVVHAGLGISPVEHKFVREHSGVRETVLLSKRNIKLIAKRSGQNADELEVMRQVLLKKGKSRMITYDVVPTEAQNPPGMKGFQVIQVVVDEINDIPDEVLKRVSE